MNTYTPLFHGAFHNPPYSRSTLHPHWTSRHDLFDNLTSGTAYTSSNFCPCVPPFPIRRRGSYPRYHAQYYNPCHIHPEHLFHFQPLQQPERVFEHREFHWPYRDHEDLFGPKRHEEHETRSVSPLGRRRGGSIEVEEMVDGEEYKPGYAETIGDDNEKTEENKFTDRVEQSNVEEERQADERLLNINSRSVQAAEYREEMMDFYQLDEELEVGRQELDARRAELAASDIFEAQRLDIAADRDEIGKEWKRLAYEREVLDRKSNEIDVWKQRLRQLKYELQVEQERLRQEKLRWRRRMQWVRSDVNMGRNYEVGDEDFGMGIGTDNNVDMLSFREPGEGWFNNTVTGETFSRFGGEEL